MAPREDDPPGDAPCFAHHLVGGHVVDAATWRDVARFGKAERTRLYAARRALSQADHRAQAARVMAALRTEIGPPEGRIIAGYWPIRGELDLRPLLADLGTRVIGVGHGFCAMPTIFPQPWDIPMDMVLLGDGLRMLPSPPEG